MDVRRNVIIPDSCCLVGSGLRRSAWRSDNQVICPLWLAGYDETITRPWPIDCDIAAVHS